MNQLRRLLLGCVALIAVAFSTSEARAWHGHHHRGFGGYPFGYNVGGYNVGVYNVGFGGIGYSRFAYSSYGFGGWPYRSYYSSYYAPISIGYSYRPSVFYRHCWPSISYSTYYAPTYYVPTYTVPVYSTFYPTCYATPVDSGATFTSFAATEPQQNSTLRNSALRNSTLASSTQFASTQSYSSLKPPLAAASNGIAGQSATTRYVAARSTPVQTVSTTIAQDAIPTDLLQSADAILAAGGYREAAQAYAQLFVRYGASDRLNLRRFIAQVASGDYEQAAVIVDLAMASGSDLQNVPLPAATLEAALGASTSLIAQRTEGLAANALHQPNDAVPMAAVATWLTLSGDLERAELFTHRANQLRASLSR